MLQIIKKSLTKQLFPSPRLDEIKKYLAKYGTSSNGIYHLYGTMDHVAIKLDPTHDTTESNTAIIGYKVVNGTVIMLTDPLCEKSRRGESIKLFLEACKKHQKDLLMLAVDQHTAEEAKKHNFKLIKIGHEPIFELSSFDSAALPSKLKSSIRQVEKKGVVLDEYSLAKMLEPTTASALNNLLNKWFMTRGSDAFRLLTEVSPVKAAAKKRFFVARVNDSIEGILCCSKIFGRNGYFLHDLIRAPFSVNGVAEALIVHALNALKAEGNEVASLGVSPLAGIDPINDRPDFPRVSRLLKWAFENVRSTYRFKELYHFKKKFLPAREEPAYLVVPQSGVKLQHVIAVLSIFSDLNLYRQFTFVLRKWRMGYNLPKPLAHFLKPETIFIHPLATFDFETLTMRLKFTFTMLFLNFYTFIYTTDIHGHIDPNILEQQGFSFQNFMDHSWYILVTSNFIHFHYPHLIFNMLGLLLFCGSLEIIGGTMLTALVYLCGIQSNIPTGLSILPILHLISPTIFQETNACVDVGASLGVMG